MELYPVKFQPLYKYRLWGGDKLKTVLKKDYKEENIGESWEVSDVSGDETTVINGPLKREVSHSILSFLSLMNHLKGQFCSFLSKMVNFNKSLGKIHAIFGHFPKKKCKFARRFS